MITLGGDHAAFLRCAKMRILEVKTKGRTMDSLAALYKNHIVTLQERTRDVLARFIDIELLVGLIGGVSATLERRCNHQTPTTSTSPTQSRFQTPYLETPACRGLWLTGQGDMPPPWAWIRAGM
jgi:hypothetical protein